MESRSFIPLTWTQISTRSYPLNSMQYIHVHHSHLLWHPERHSNNHYSSPPAEDPPFQLLSQFRFRSPKPLDYCTVPSPKPRDFVNRWEQSGEYHQAIIQEMSHDKIVNTLSHGTKAVDQLGSTDKNTPVSCSLDGIMKLAGLEWSFFDASLEVYVFKPK